MASGGSLNCGLNSDSQPIKFGCAEGVLADLGMILAEG